MKRSEFRKLIREEVRNVLSGDKEAIKKLIDATNSAENKTRHPRKVANAEAALVKLGIYNSDGEVASDAPDWVADYYEENWT